MEMNCGALMVNWSNIAGWFNKAKCLPQSREALCQSDWYHSNIGLLLSRLDLLSQDFESFLKVQIVFHINVSRGSEVSAVWVRFFDSNRRSHPDLAERFTTWRVKLRRRQAEPGSVLQCKDTLN